MIEAAPAAHPLRGFLLFATALLLFAAMDTTSKVLVADYPVPLVVAIRYFVHCLLMVVVLTPRLGSRLVRTTRTRLVVLRGVSLAAASLCMGLALKRMPVAESTAVLFLAPMIVVVLAGPLLGETIARTDWVAVVMGFAGVLLIARPGSGLQLGGVIFGLCAAASTATYQLLSRVLVRTESVVALLFHTALAGTVVFGICVPWFIEGPRPTALQVLLFISMGALGGIGHYFFTAAYRNAAASVLAPTLYVQLLWATLLGWLVFGHVPTGLTLLGMAVVAAAGVLVALKRRPAVAPPPRPDYSART